MVVPDPASARVVVLTGAGVSADSGLATFRGAGGLWEGRRVEDVATPEAWHRDPAAVWRFYQLRRAALADVEPNAGHRALVRLEQRVTEAGGGFTLITQNVDDLHERAGTGALLHMHGELAQLRCEVCATRKRDLEYTDASRFLACEGCGHDRLRPDVVWFGELPYHLDEIERALAVASHFLACGTSGVVYPAAGLLAAARARGARTFVNSLDPPDNVVASDTFLPGRAAEVLPDFVDRLCDELGC
jgi:NAD-dependent deacetylase